MFPKGQANTMTFASNFQEQSHMIKVLIADDSVSMRESLSSLLNPKCGFQVVGLASDGLEAVEKARELHPDVVIMDVQMPNMDGVEATRQIKQTLPGVGILLFSVFTDHIEAGIAAGADSNLMKDCDIRELCAALKRVAAISTAGK